MTMCESINKLKQQQSVCTVLVDTNVILTMGEDIKSFGRIGLRIAVTRSILRELRRKDQSLYTYACANFDVVNDSTEEIVTEARYIFTHYPDNFVIAAAKINGFPLISYDKVLLKVAVSQGVEACIPEQLIKSKRILNRTRGVHAVISQTTCANVIAKGSENIDNKHCNELVLIETQRKENGEIIRTYRPHAVEGV
jgi:rRNA-processing protein FCF1